MTCFIHDLTFRDYKKNIICSTVSLLALFLVKNTIYHFYYFWNKIPVHFDILSTNVSIKLVYVQKGHCNWGHVQLPQYSVTWSSLNIRFIFNHRVNSISFSVVKILLKLLNNQQRIYLIDLRSFDFLVFDGNKFRLLR